MDHIVGWYTEPYVMLISGCTARGISSCLVAPANSENQTVFILTTIFHLRLAISSETPVHPSLRSLEDINFVRFWALAAVMSRLLPQYVIAHIQQQI